jgi:hypothetical protein
MAEPSLQSFQILDHLAQKQQRMAITLVLTGVFEELEAGKSELALDSQLQEQV